jgi:hypothetical protein
MRQISVTVPLLILTLAVAVPRTVADEEGEAKKQNQLVGTWKLVSAKWGGREIKITEEIKRLKHVTPTHFMWVVYGKDGKVTAAAGGCYAVKGEVYEEILDYGIGIGGIQGKLHSFKWKVDGNKWYHNGKLSTGLTIEEVWERVEKK